MSALMRMAFRLCAIEVLRADPVIGPATEGRVFDSEMDAIDPTRPLPVIIVHAEGTNGSGWSSNDGGPPFNSKTDFVFEIAQVAKGEQDGTPVLFRPETDRELEAAIEVLEWRIPEALAFSESALATSMRRLVLKRITDMRSERFASDDVGVRLASRLLTLTVEMQDEITEVFHPDDPLPTGEFANLPEPLRSLGPLFTAGSSARSVLDLVAAQLPAPAHGDEFEGADITIDPAPDGTRP